MLFICYICMTNNDLVAVIGDLACLERPGSFSSHRKGVFRFCLQAGSTAESPSGSLHDLYQPGDQVMVPWQKIYT